MALGAVFLVLSFSLQCVQCKRAVSRTELWVRAKMRYTAHVYPYICGGWLIFKNPVQAQFISSHVGNTSYLFQHDVHSNKSPILYLNKNNLQVKYFHSASSVLSDMGAFSPSLST